MSEMEERALPLKGIKVLDIAVMYASPFTATLLSDFGADVIKVEHPSGDSLRNIGKKKNGIGLWFKQVNRNKKSVTINLGKPEGQELLKELAKDADVIVENFRPGTLEKWNIGWDVLSELNPRLVLMRLSAYDRQKHERLHGGGAHDRRTDQHTGAFGGKGGVDGRRGYGHGGIWDSLSLRRAGRSPFCADNAKAAQGKHGG